MTAPATESAETVPAPQARAAPMPEARRRLLTEVLASVARAFYLTLRVLPRGLREPVGLAYLLARAADTLADTRLLPPSERLRRLLAFRAQVEGPAVPAELAALVSSLSERQDLPAERALLTALPEAFALLEALPEADRARVRAVVVDLTRGMEIDLTTFPAEDSGRLVALPDAPALDRYTYWVAGCVGEFWTAMTMAHTPALRHWDAARLAALGVRFGKALQFTNVLRDVGRDLRIGRCYLPADALASAGLRPEELLDPAAGARARPVLAAQLRVALEHYAAAEEYLLAIPRRCLRLRLAVLWPILIGLATLAKLSRNEAWLDPRQPTKVTRLWVYAMLLASLPCAASNTLLRGWIARLRKESIQYTVYSI